MKTKFIIPGLLAALMLITIPIITVAITETPNVVNVMDMNPYKKLTSEDTELEEPNVEETCVEGNCFEETNVEEPKREETISEQTEYFSYGYIKASFSGIYDKDVDYDHGLFFTKDIIVTATLTKPLKVNGETIIESGTTIKVEIEKMGNLGFRLTMNCYIGGIPRYRLALSGFASGITVTF